VCNTMCFLFADSTSFNSKSSVAPNSVIVGGLDHNGNPKMVPFRDGVRVDWVAAEIDRLESRIDETFLITLLSLCTYPHLITVCLLREYNNSRSLPSSQ
jgi:hypothetical protein